MTLLYKLGKLYDIWHGRGQQVKLEKTAVTVLEYAWA